MPLDASQHYLIIDFLIELDLIYHSITSKTTFWRFMDSLGGKMLVYLIMNSKNMWHVCAKFLTIMIFLKGLSLSRNKCKLQLKAPSSAFLISRYILRLGQRGRCCFCAACPNCKMYLEIRSANEGALKAPSFALLISRYILRLWQAAKKQQRPRCPNP